MRASTASTCARARKQGTITAISGTLGIRAAHVTNRARRSHARNPLDSPRERGLERSPDLQPETSKEAGAGVVRASWAQALALLLLVAVCYANSLAGPFLFDGPFLNAPRARLDYSWRPLVWASWDLNRALGGMETRGYHVFNALVHLGCGLLLLGVLRQAAALVAPGVAARTRDALAFVTASLWVCHPLQTAAVTYLSQRAEALGALFYLAVLYAFLRSASAARRRAWEALALLALALGLVTKEILVTAPVVLFLADAVLVSGGWRAALRARRGFHAAAALVT